MNVSINRSFLLDTLTSLVRTNSINPTLVPGGPGEAEIARLVAAMLGEIGLEVSTHEPEPGRTSVVGILRGQGGGRSLMLNAHYDTVGIDGMTDPFSAEVRDGRLYGRGAYDMKGSLAACIAAIRALAGAGAPLAGDVVIAAVADEEYASLGTADLVGRYRVDAAIVTEPTELAVCLAHKGFLWIGVETIGQAAHGSRFDLGVDANMRMGRFLAELDQLERQLRSRRPHPQVGPPSLHAALLAGGTGLSTYSARCELKIERRTIPGETEAQVLAEIQELIDKLSKADDTFEATAKILFARPPFEVRRDAAVVQSLAQTAAGVLGREPDYVGQTPWMDAALLAVAGIETVVMGPCGAGAHAIEEWVDLASVEKMARILAETAVNYCGLQASGSS